LRENYILKSFANFINEGLESREEKNWTIVCNERDVEGKNHIKAFSKFCNERKEVISLTQASVSRQNNDKINILSEISITI